MMVESPKVLIEKLLQVRRGFFRVSAKRRQQTLYPSEKCEQFALFNFHYSCSFRLRLGIICTGLDKSINNILVLQEAEHD